MVDLFPDDDPQNGPPRIFLVRPTHGAEEQAAAPCEICERDHNHAGKRTCGNTVCQSVLLRQEKRKRCAKLRQHCRAAAAKAKMTDTKPRFRGGSA